jgi:dihydroflavonol-4-reductase
MGTINETKDIAGLNLVGPSTTTAKGVPIGVQLRSSARVAAEMADDWASTVLVTGGSGFLGGWCVIGLLQRGHIVRTTVRSVSREPEVRATVCSELDPEDRLTVLAADLTSDEGWKEAVGGCDYVLHVASPFPSKQPKDPDELIVPAREGTLRVLGASLDAGVKRVVLTSSVAAIRLSDEAGARPLNEDDWTDSDAPGLTPYVRSKTIAERAAWDLVRERGAEDRLSVINPGAIIGPVLNDDLSFSLQAVTRLLNGMPGMPRLGFSLVDVRDVVDLEIMAMRAPDAGGERFIAATQFLWMAEIGAILRQRLGEAASKVPVRTVPDLFVRGMALFDPDIRSVIGGLGKRTELSSEKARDKLGWAPRSIEDTIAETGESLLRQTASVAA